jgi:predicted TIM-barrel fold metal-dependent hydrolase
VDKEYRERAPRLVADPSTDRLVCDMTVLPPVGILAGCARGDDEARNEGRWEDDVMPASYDPKPRIAEMRRDGVDGEVLFPSICLHFFQIPDLEFQWALLRAYNTWIAEFVSADPGRFKGIAILNPDDPVLAVKEVERCDGLGLSGILIPQGRGDRPPYHDPSFDPLWEAVVDAGMPVHLHAGAAQDRAKAYNRASLTRSLFHNHLFQDVIVEAVLRGLFDRFPDLTIVSVENEAGWAGQLIEKTDYFWNRYHKLSVENFGVSFCRRTPSEYFHANVRATFMRDRTAILACEVIGEETLMWGNDFPHHASTWPNSRSVLDRMSVGVPPERIERVVGGNAARLYGF